MVDIVYPRWIANIVGRLGKKRVSVESSHLRWVRGKSHPIRWSALVIPRMGLTVQPSTPGEVRHHDLQCRTGEEDLPVP